MFDRQHLWNILVNFVAPSTIVASPSISPANAANPRITITSHWDSIAVSYNFLDPALKPLLKIAGFIWASPYTLLGFLIGSVGLLFGGRVRVVGTAIEFYDGLSTVESVVLLQDRTGSNLAAATSTGWTEAGFGPSNLNNFASFRHACAISTRLCG